MISNGLLLVVVRICMEHDLCSFYSQDVILFVLCCLWYSFYIGTRMCSDDELDTIYENKLFIIIDTLLYKNKILFSVGSLVHVLVLIVKTDSNK